MRARVIVFLMLGQFVASRAWADEFKTVQDHCANIKASPKCPTHNDFI
jgi:hypothetical protein